MGRVGGEGTFVRQAARKPLTEIIDGTVHPLELGALGRAPRRACPQGFMPRQAVTQALRRLQLVVHQRPQSGCPNRCSTWRWASPPRHAALSQWRRCRC